MMRALAPSLLALGALIAGCEAPPSTAPVEPEQSIDLSQVFRTQPVRAGTPRRDSDEREALPSHLNSPMASAKELATAQPVRDRAALREIELHAALYSAALASDPVQRRSGYLLRSVERNGAKAMSGREFEMRVLAKFVGHTQRVAWNDAPLAWMLQDNAPGGPAAFAWFEVLRFDEALATVEADVCLETLKLGTRKIRVEAIFDGQAWNVRDLGTRTVW